MIRSEQGSLDSRLAGARRVLEAAGITAPVSAAGPEDEIVAVQGGAELRERLAELAPEIRALGFRYVTLELSGTTHDDEDS